LVFSIRTQQSTFPHHVIQKANLIRSNLEKLKK
jgi:hypothetical protein